jgi:hypothetical protein
MGFIRAGFRLRYKIEKVTRQKERPKNKIKKKESWELFYLMTAWLKIYVKCGTSGSPPRGIV